MKKNNLNFDYWDLCYFEEGNLIENFNEFEILQILISKAENSLLKKVENSTCKKCGIKLEIKHNTNGRLIYSDFCTLNCRIKFEEEEFSIYYKYIDFETSEKNKEIRLKCRSKIRARLKYLLKNPDFKNKEKFFDLIGCSIQDYKNHIEKYFIFDKNMNWENYGEYWEIDHIKPLDSFDLENEYDLEEAFHFSNVRALTIKDNRLLNTVLNKASIYWTPYHKLIYYKKRRVMDLVKVNLNN